eukprot:TRINITY_DN3296_c0_g1_i1.p2 TRINITY_DN3296_c0_g1~~TRINITY_DN3296_c0_g1_i1.p2  ORF type:complete len:176 (-),score=73.90 TRINITY_DN3296_c0_g1_i1:615-1100(-)
MAKQKTKEQVQQQQQKQKEKKKEIKNEGKKNNQNTQNEGKEQKKQQQPQKQAIAQKTPDPQPQPKKTKNKQRTMVGSTRGITSIHRHLMKDWRRLLPHHKKEPKLDSKDHLTILNEITGMKDCNNCLFFESRKKKDLFLWLAKTPKRAFGQISCPERLFHG